MTLVIFQEGTEDDKHFIVQYLEHDIVAQGRTLKEALNGFAYQLTATQLLKEEFGPKGTVPSKAPPYYWDLVGKKQEGVDIL